MTTNTKANAEDAMLIEEAIIAQFGERCPDFDAECHCCRVWRALDDLRDGATKAINDAVMAERERWSPASIYFERYCQDEADSAENCITEQQHTDAKAFAAAVRGEG